MDSLGQQIRHRPESLFMYLSRFAMILPQHTERVVLRNSSLASRSKMLRVQRCLNVTFRSAHLRADELQSKAPQTCSHHALGISADEQ